MKDHPSQWIASSLTCHEVTALVSDYLDGRLALISKVRVGLHLASCAHCRAYVKQIRLVQETLALFPKQPPLPINRLRLRQQFAASHSL